MKIVGLFANTRTKTMIEDEQKLRTVRIMNAMAIFFAISALLFILVFSVLGAPHISVYLLALTILFSIVPLLNSKNKTSLARVLLVFSLYAGITFFHLILGKSSFIFIVLIPILCVPFSISTKADTPLNYFALVLSTVLFILFGFTDMFNSIVLYETLENIKYPFTVFMMLIPFYVLRTLRKEQSEYTQRLQKSLMEQQALLKEVHHRVKNNFQVINSLINFELSGDLKSKDGIQALNDTQKRIRLMAHVYNLIHVNENISNMELNQFLMDISSYVSRSYSDTLNVKYVTNLTEMSFQVNMAMPLGILVCEAISILSPRDLNQDPAIIKIQMDRVDDRLIKIRIWNQFGADKNLRKHHGVGFMLIEQLADELQGEYNYDSRDGMELQFSIAKKAA